MKSPLRYPGGKTRACAKLYDIFTYNFDHKNYNTLMSPFVGGGSFELHMFNKHAFKIMANDKFKPLYSFWNACKNNKSDLCAKIQKEFDSEISKNDFTNMRKCIMESADEVDQATKFFVINRCSFSGATLSGGFSAESASKRFTQNSIENVKSLKLHDFDFYNLDFQEFIQKWTPGSFIFLDPPYYLGNQSKLYGKQGDMHENFDHEKLYESIKNIKGWMMTYNDCEYIRELYKDFTITETTWTYGMNKTKKSSEIVIICK